METLTETLSHAYAAGDLERARTLAKAILDRTLADPSAAPSERMIALNTLAQIESELCESTEAATHFDQALQLHRNSGSAPDPIAAVSHTGASRLAWEARDYPRAQAHARAAVEIEKALDPDSRSTSAALGNLASVLYSAGQLLESETLHRESLAVLATHAGAEDPEYAMGLNNLALVLEELGRYDEAARHLENAVRIQQRQEPQDPAQLAVYLHHLAGIYRLSGQFAAALQTFRRALSLRTNCLDRDDPLIGDTLNDLALLHVNIGRLRVAERLYRRALRQYQARSPARPDRVSAVLTNLGGVHDSLGDGSRAIEFYRKALEALADECGNDHPDTANALDNLGGVLARQSHPEEARAALEKALAIRKSRYGEQHPDVAISLNNLSVFWLGAGDTLQSERYGRDALSMRRALLGPKHPLVAQSLLALARTLAVDNRRPEALQAMEEAAEIHDTLVDQVFHLHSDAQRLAFVDTLLGALHAYLGLLAGEADRTHDQVRRAFEHTMRRLRLGAEVVAHQRAATAQQPADTDADTLKLREQLQNTRAELARLLLSGESGAEDLGERLEWLEARLLERVQGTAPSGDRIGSVGDAPCLHADTAALSSRLSPRSCLIQFVQIAAFDFSSPLDSAPQSWRYLAFVVQSQAEPSVVLVDLGPAQCIDAAINVYLHALLGGPPPSPTHTSRPSPAERTSGNQGPVLEPSNTPAGELSIRYPSGSAGLRDFAAPSRVGGKAEAPELGAALAHRLLEPLRPLFQNAERLLLALDGQLFRLPFEALPWPDGAKRADALPVHYLSDEFDIQYLSVSRDILRDNPTSAHTAAPLVLADPDFDLTEGAATPPLPQYPFAALPGARREGTSIAALLGVPLITREHATKTALQNRISPRILHLATHGFFLRAPEPSALSPHPNFVGKRMEILRAHPLLRSGLALAGCNSWLQGQKTPRPALEGLLTALDVSALDLTGTDLVVLSGCETALGEWLSGEGVYGLSRAFTLAGAGVLIMSLWRVGDELTCELMEELYRIAAQGSDYPTALIAARRLIKQRHPAVRDWAAFVCQSSGAPPPSPSSPGRGL